jgi:hypothetical protein
VIYAHAIKKDSGYAHVKKISQAHMWHALNFCLLTCHSVHVLLEFNSYIDLTSGTQVWK